MAMTPVGLRPPHGERQYCTAKAKTTGNRCTHWAIPGGTVCRFHGGAAPQVIRKAELRYAEARDDALYLLAVQLRQDVEVAEKTSANGGGAKRSTEYRDLLATVKELTTQLELWAGRATSHIEIVEVQAWIHAYIIATEPYVLPAKRSDWIAALPHEAVPIEHLAALTLENR